MGVDLTLLPVDRVTQAGDWLCTHAFDLDLNRVIWPLLELRKQPVPGRVWWPIEDMSDAMRALVPEPWPHIGGPLQGAMFGVASEKGLQYALAKEIGAAILEAELDVASINWFERAALAYIAALPGDTKVVFYVW